VGRHSLMKATLADAEKLGIPASIFVRRWFILATLCGSLLSVMIANGGLNLALPSIATDLGLGSLGLTWVVEIYSLLFAALLFTFAAVGDRYGRKVVMQTGLVLFVLSSLYAGLVASSGMELIVTRAIMGIGGAMVMPTTLSVINVVFPPQERPRAVAIWTAIAGVGMMLGFVIGGVLLDHLGWESTFFLSAGVAAVTLVCNQFLVMDSRDERRTPVDWLGGFLSTAGLLGLVYGITEAPSRGLDDRWVLVGLVEACVCLVAFVLWQRRTTHPMLDVRLFARRAFGVSALVVTLAFFALGGVFFGVSQLFMLVMGYGALQTSLAIIPLMLPMLILSPFVPLLTARIGIRWTVAVGLVLVVVGFFVMARWPTVPTLRQIYGGMSILTGGLAFAMTPATSLMMSAVPRSRSGMGSAMNDTTRELGGALGIAALGALLSSGYTGKIASTLAGAPEQVRAIAEKSLAGALALAAQYGEAGSEFAYVAKTAWMDSLEYSMIVAALICAASAIIAAIWMPHREKWPAPDSVQPAEDAPQQPAGAQPAAAQPAATQAAAAKPPRLPRLSLPSRQPRLSLESEETD
jgi:EmrB/QacA subfamily drug resistance transporter